MGPNSSQKCARLEWPGHLLLRENFVMFYYVGHDQRFVSTTGNMEVLLSHTRSIVLRQPVFTLIEI